jgi:uncharacterized phage-associated protein
MLDCPYRKVSESYQFLFIYLGLFNYAFSISEYKKKLVYDKHIKSWKACRVGRSLFNLLCRHLAGGTEKRTKNPGWDNWSLVQI